MLELVVTDHLSKGADVQFQSSVHCRVLERCRFVCYVQVCREHWAKRASSTFITAHTDLLTDWLTASLLWLSKSGSASKLIAISFHKKQQQSNSQPIRYQFSSMALDIKQVVLNRLGAIIQRQQQQQQSLNRLERMVLRVERTNNQPTTIARLRACCSEYHNSKREAFRQWRSRKHIQAGLLICPSFIRKSCWGSEANERRNEILIQNQSSK